jgi:hypothetical protein
MVSSWAYGYCPNVYSSTVKIVLEQYLDLVGMLFKTNLNVVSHVVISKLEDSI